MERTQPATHGDLASIQAGDQGIVFAVLRRIREGQAASGKPFLDLEFGDTSATRVARIWTDAGLDVYHAALSLEPGSAVKVRFVAETYKDQVQLRIAEIRAARAEEFAAETLFGRELPAANGLTARHLVIDIETAAAHELEALPPSVLAAVTRIAELDDSEPDKVAALSPLLSDIFHGDSFDLPPRRGT